jgi:membrane protease YdiL (CAAX protease family)
MMPSSRGMSTEAIRVAVRIVLFIMLAWAGQAAFPILLRPYGDLLTVSAMSVFAAGVIANGVLARMYEEGRISAAGLRWSSSSGRELATGMAIGCGAAALIVAAAILFQLASFESKPGEYTQWVNLLFIFVVLLFGAFGEELLFHGYAFQLLTRTAGDYAALLPVGVLFGVAHMGNENVTLLAVVNTTAWGILLGYAYLRTRALWLSIGMHFGWNAAMPLFGINLSGFTIGVTGYGLRWRAGQVWSGGDYGLEGSIFTTLVAVILFFLLWKLIPKTVAERGE